MGRCHWRDHRRRSNWQHPSRVNRCSRRSCSRRINRRGHPAGSSCALRPASSRWLSLCALGGDAGLLLQSLYRARLRSSRRAARRSYSGRRYRPAFPQTLIDTNFCSPGCGHSCFSAIALAIYPRALALRRSFSVIPATNGDSFRRATCVWHQTPCGSRCSVHSARDQASHLDF